MILCSLYRRNLREVKIVANFAMSDSDINTVIDQLSHASVDGAATLSFAGRGLKLDSEADGRLCVRAAGAREVGWQGGQLPPIDND